MHKQADTRFIAHRQPGKARVGFTVMELLVVVTVIIALAGMIIPSISFFRRQANESATGTLVRSIAAAITAYQKTEISVPSRGMAGLTNGKIRRMWDFNIQSEAAPVFDYILDGDPNLDPGFSATDKQAALNCGYRGFLGTTGIAVPKGNIDAQGRLVDSWKNLLRIRFASETYGSTWFGVWSNGADGKEGTADDICSWKNATR